MDFKDYNARLRYILRTVYDELQKRACLCDYCDDANICFTKLKNLLKEQEIDAKDLDKA
jgi:hypothetical protein